MDWFFVFFPLALLFAGFAMGAILVPSIARLWFAVFMAWWWPWRDDSAATLIAAAIDLDGAADQWRVTGYGENTLSSTALGADIESGFDGELKLRVDGEWVPLSAWDDFKLGWAVMRWDSRYRRRQRFAGSRRAARKVKETMERQRAAQEKAR